MLTVVHLPNSLEKTQPHLAYSVWCQKDHTLGSRLFRTVERKPRHTSRMPTLSAVGQKEMNNAENYESLLSSIQWQNDKGFIYVYNYMKRRKRSQNYASLISVLNVWRSERKICSFHLLKLLVKTSKKQSLLVGHYKD